MAVEGEGGEAAVGKGSHGSHPCMDECCARWPACLSMHHDAPVANCAGTGATVSSEAGPSSSSSSLSAKKKVKCVYFNLPGGCRRGEACHFKHVPREHHHDHEGGHEEAGAAAMGGGDEEEGMAVDDLSHALHSKLRLPQTISFGRKMQDHRK